MVTLKYNVEIPTRKRTKLQSLISEFVQSDKDIVEFQFIPGEDYASASVARTTLAIAVMRSRYAGITVRKRGDRIFMLKEK